MYYRTFLVYLGGILSWHFGALTSVKTLCQHLYECIYYIFIDIWFSQRPFCLKWFFIFGFEVTSFYAFVWGKLSFLLSEELCMYACFGATAMRTVFSPKSAWLSIPYIIAFYFFIYIIFNCKHSQNESTKLRFPFHCILTVCWKVVGKFLHDDTKNYCLTQL